MIKHVTAKLVVVLCTALLSVSGTQAQQQAVDPVLTAIVQNQVNIASQKMTTRNECKSVLLAMELNTSLMATYLESHPEIERGFRASLKRQEAKKGRAALLYEIGEKLKQSGREVPDTELGDKLLDVNMSASLRALQRSLRDMQRQMPADQPIQLIKYQTAEQTCVQQHKPQISIAEWNMGTWCVLMMLEPSFIGETVCTFWSVTWIGLKSNCYYWCDTWDC